MQALSTLLHLLLVVVVVEAVTEVLVESYIMNGWRAFWSRRGEALAVLVNCGYCTSMWIGLAAAYATWFDPLELVLGWRSPVGPLVGGVVAHRLSNVWHGLARRAMDRPAGTAAQG